jgi:DNA-binding CsgD family transcriptional regulator
MEVGGCHYRLVREGQRDLTPRERDVVEQVLRGSTNKVIAYDLGIAHATVRVLLHRVMVKLGVQSRGELLKRLRPPVANESSNPPKAPLLTGEMATAHDM